MWQVRHCDFPSFNQSYCCLGALLLLYLRHFLNSLAKVMLIVRQLVMSKTQSRAIPQLTYVHKED